MDQLLNPDDHSPLSQKELTQEAEDAILNNAFAGKLKTPVTLEIQIPDVPDPPAAAPIGLLVLASEEAKRFYPGMGTLYLERLGQLVGAALVRMLENKLAELIQFGEENDGISDKLHELTLALLAAHAPRGIVAALALHLREGFAVPHHALRVWSLAGDCVPGLTDRVPTAVHDSVAAMAQPACGALAVNEASDWFGEMSPHLRAFACIPLRPAPAAAPIGLLVLASEEAKRFYPGMGTLYLERLGQLIGAALVRMQG